MPTFYYIIISYTILLVHSLVVLNFFDKILNSRRFSKMIIYLSSGVVSLGAVFMFYATSIPSSVIYVLSILILFLQLQLLYRDPFLVKISLVFGVLLHLFVFRAIVLSFYSLITNESLDYITSSPILFVQSFIISLILHIASFYPFMKYISLEDVSNIANNENLLKRISMLTASISTYFVFNTLIFNTEFFSYELITQQIILPLLLLSVFYIILLLIVNLVSLNTYKEKNAELEVKIDKSKILESALFNLTEIVLEINCSQDKLTRFIVGNFDMEISDDSYSNLLQIHYEKFIHPEDTNIFSASTSKAIIENFNNGITTMEIIFRGYKLAVDENTKKLTAKTNDYLWHKSTLNVYQDEDMSIKAISCIDEIHSEKIQEIHLINKAERDSLTGAYNKTTAYDKISNHLKNGGVGTLVMFDLDNFKGINDNMGHSYGDEVLINTYNSAQSLFRSRDIISRVGGDEFIVFLMGAIEKSVVEDKVKKLCNMIHRTYTADNGVSITVSTSVGIAFAPKDGYDIETLFNAADISMYASKHTGKNTFTFYDANSLKDFKPVESSAYQRLSHEIILSEDAQ